MPVPPIILLAVIMCGSAVMITTIAAVSRAVTHRQRAAANLPKDEVLQRLERIEQAVEVTAIEVERLAEANRFLTKLLAEKSSVS
ncbi:MAG: hypothetical protein JF602_02300 [Gemmatimonadetes bacterium]|jgi:hypothetical protein|nr:hypothetical protein [Gemmatimonadota bacterium]